MRPLAGLLPRTPHIKRWGNKQTNKPELEPESKPGELRRRLSRPRRRRL